MGGISFTTLGCDSLRRGETLFCGTADQLAGDEPDRDVVVFQSFQIAADESCSSLDIDEAWLNGRLDQRWRAGVSKAVAQELMDGANTNATPSFKEAATVNASVANKLALPAVEAALADKLNGAEGMIHMSPQAFALAAINDNFQLDGNVWRTGSGHIVVTDAGYTGQAPTGGSATAGSEYIYGSGPVAVKVGPPRRIAEGNVGIIDFTRNILHATYVAQAIFAFDPCAVVAQKFTLAT
jgi:hypothetical protein